MALSGIRWLFLPTLLLLCSRLLPAVPSDYEGRPVAAVRFDPPTQPLSPAELNLLAGIQPGEPLRLSLVRTALQRLYSTGRYEDIEVDARMEGDAVVITFLTRQNWFISRISIEGVREPPNREQLLSATKLTLGERYTQESIPEAIAGLRQILQANGFHRPRIQPLIERYPDYDELHITFLIDPGPRAYFTRPVIQGNLKLPVEDILGATGWRRWWGLLGWHPFTESRMQRGVDRVRRAYLEKDFLLAKVEVTGLEYDPENASVAPQLHIEAGPKVVVSAAGAGLSNRRLKQLVPIFQEQSVDSDLLMEGRRNITQYFQSRGYFDAQVQFQRQQVSAEREQIEYVIERGSRYKLVHIGISGNRYFDELTIRERLSMLAASRLRNPNGVFSEDHLNRDKEAIENLYRGNGFRDVRVESRLERNYRGRERELAVFLTIHEGEQWFVNSLELTGVDLRLYEHLRSMLASTEGQPYSTLNLATDRDNILGFYYDNGYPDATLEIVSTPAAEPRRMDVKFIVNEGRRLFVRDVRVNGLVSTRPSLVSSRVSLEPGQPLSLSSMVFSQRRLYDLGIFAKVDMALQNPAGNTREKRVLFQMEEASRYSLNGGFGAEFGRFGGSQTSLSSPAGGAAFAPRLSLGISRLNFLGVGHTVGVQTRLSTLQRRGLVTYLAPQFRGAEDYNLTVTAFFDDSKNVRTFSSRRLEGAVQFGQRLNRALSAQYRFVYRRVSASDVKIDPALIPLFSQPVRVGLLATTFINDRRDEPLDATRGHYTSLDLSLASKGFTSETDFFRLLGRNSSYHRLGRDYILTRNTTFGWINNYGARDIPLPERFFAGGASSHRAFPENQAGPRDLVTGFPLGGRSLLFNQTELRFPLVGANLGAVFFHDAGNVYDSIGAISFRFSQRDHQDFNYMVHALGFGVRYRTPIGPIRVDLAYGINSPRFVGYRGSLEDLIRQTGEPVPQRVSRFQFHFSLGQAF